MTDEDIIIGEELDRMASIITNVILETDKIFRYKVFYDVATKLSKSKQRFTSSLFYDMANKLELRLTDDAVNP